MNMEETPVCFVRSRFHKFQVPWAPFGFSTPPTARRFRLRLPRARASAVGAELGTERVIQMAETRALVCPPWVSFKATERNTHHTHADLLGLTEAMLCHTMGAPWI